MKCILQFFATKKNRKFIKILRKWKFLELLQLKYIKFGKLFKVNINFLSIEELQYKISYFSLIQKYSYKLIKIIEFYFMKLMLRYFLINNSIFFKEYIKIINITSIKNVKKKLIILNLTRQNKIYLLFQIFSNYDNFKKVINNINIFWLFSKILLLQFETLISPYFELLYFNTYSFRKNRNSLQAIGFLKMKNSIFLLLLNLLILKWHMYILFIIILILLNF